MDKTAKQIADEMWAHYGAELMAAKKAKVPEEAAALNASLPELGTEGSTAIFIPKRQGKKPVADTSG